MSTALERLLAAASPALVADAPDRDLLPEGMVLDQLYELLVNRNGFYALDRALLVRPLGRTAAGAEYGIAQWNADGLWRHEYGTLTNRLVFFAEDLFGGQFAVSGGNVVTFDPETGAIEKIAEDILGWAKAIIDNYEFLTAYPLAHAWQEANGPIPTGHRLVPILPFALGGEYRVDNLVPRESAQAMRFRGSLARQMHGVPPGTTVQIQVDWGESGRSAH